MQTSGRHQPLPERQSAVAAAAGRAARRGRRGLLREPPHGRGPAAHAARPAHAERGPGRVHCQLLRDRPQHPGAHPRAHAAHRRTAGEPADRARVLRPVVVRDVPLEHEQPAGGPPEHQVFRRQDRCAEINP